MKRLPYTLLLLWLAAAVQAQEDPEVSADGMPPRYAVELIIFKYTELDSPGTEVFLPEPIEEDASVLEFGDTAPPPPEAPADMPAELQYRVLGEDELTLQDTRRMLSRLQAYEPLMHFGWLQDAVPDADAVPLPLERFGTPPEGLQGTVSLNLSRFLHLGVDVSLAADESRRRPAPVIPDAASGGPADGLPLDGSTGVRYAPLRYEISEARIMKSGETRYYDHPHFGVIARVTRIDGSSNPAAAP